MRLTPIKTTSAGSKVPRHLAIIMIDGEINRRDPFEIFVIKFVLGAWFNRALNSQIVGQRIHQVDQAPAPAGSEAHYI